MSYSTIESLDLDPIKVKLMDPKDGEGWSLAKADAVEALYKRFLMLNLRHRGMSLVPTADIDTFWHCHILDTRKYAGDCQKVFGYFLHHFPYFGMRGSEDASNLQRAFILTREVYEAEFGEPMARGESAHCDGPTGCDAEPCAPEPSCSGDPDPTRTRPRLQRELLALS